MQDINRRMTTGIIWMICAKLIDRSIGIVSTLILARLLVPADFGLVAMATAIGAMLDLMGAFSFDVALIQNKNAERRHYDTVWTFNIMLGLACALGMVLLAGPAAGFYKEPRLTEVMYVLAIPLVVGAFTNVGVVNFRKELQFRKEFLLMFTRRVITFAVTITAAVMFRSYWALLLGMSTGKIVGMGLSYVLSPYRPRLSLAAARELFNFSKWMLANNILHFLRYDGCTFLLGRMFGARGLGIYTVSYEISNLPSTELVAPINRVAMPGFSKLSDTALIAHSYLRMMGMITLLILPVGVGIAAVAEPLVLVALGDKWLAAIPLIAILGINGSINATQTSNGAVCLAMGKPHRLTIVNTCIVLVLFPTLYAGVTMFGLVGAGYAYLATQLVNVPLGMSMTRGFLKFRWSQVGAVVWRPVAASAMMYFGVRAFDPVVADYLPGARLLLDAAVGAVVYAVGILALWTISKRPQGAERFCLVKARLLQR